MLQTPRGETIAYSFIVWIALAGPLFAQTAGEGSGSESVGGGAMIKSPEHAEKGGDASRDPKQTNDDSAKRDQRSNQRSDEEVSSGSPSPSTAPK